MGFHVNFPDWLGSSDSPTVRNTRQAPRVIRAKYDAAQTTAENRRHWINADSLGGQRSLSLPVRQKLRERARYEVANNSYAAGIVDTLCNDLIGTGPRLQMLSENEIANTFIESEFAAWCEEVDLAAKLRTMHAARLTDGEGFALLSNNAKLNTVQLDVSLVECDRVTDPGSADYSDGIEYDRYGNPKRYKILNDHPGDGLGVSGFLPSSYRTYGADSVIHWFKPRRPGQLRGAPDITPALPLFGQLRRYTLAVLSAAETAANISAVIHTEMPPGEAEEYDPEFELERGRVPFLPKGWDLRQLQAEQPTSTYAVFKAEILAEIARCLNVPFNVAAGNSSGYNYASGRLDFQSYFKSLQVEIAAIVRRVINRIFLAWLEEAAFMPGYLPVIENYSHVWFWDGTEHVDPLKEAKAQETRLKNGTTTLADEHGRKGHDWRVKMRQQAIERAFQAELDREYGLTPEAKQPLPKPTGADE